MTNAERAQLLDWATWATVRAIRIRQGAIAADLVTADELRAFAAECRERAR